ncbi:MAG: glycoside hydrolase family 127 protein [Armatimonadetes bacterium]|nr:glycoside hydrolase family 127 protein [Armatimonadota bacterium]
MLVICHLLLATTALAPGANLAPLATPSTSYVSGHETLGAVNNGYSPAHSDDKSHGAYGNWPRTGTQWVQLDWAQPVSTNAVEVYWFDDQRGVRLPTACRLLTWTDGKWQPVPGAEGLGLLVNRFNTTRFPELLTGRLRLEFDGQPTFSTGLLQWRVLDTGRSPNFAPTAAAGPDRTVVLSGATYLSGSCRDDGKPLPTPRLRWAKTAGPGTVTFGDATAASTWARFSALGDYELTLTADDGDLRGRDALRVRVRPMPATVALAEAPMGSFSLTSPLWRARAKVLITTWIPHVVAKLADPALPEGGIANFVEAAKKNAGQPAARHVGPPWANAYTMNAIEAMCAALMVEADGDAEVAQAQAKLRVTLDDWIDKVVAAQEPDGWLHTQYTLNGGPRWRAKGDHQGYVAGYLIDAALAHYQLTGGRDLRLLGAARRCADLWVRSIGPAPKQTWYDGHQALELALCRLADFVDSHDGAGRGQAYRDLSRFLLDSRDKGEEYDQSHLPVTHQYEAVGHAVRAVYLYTGLTDVAQSAGDVDYHSAVLSLWDNLVNRKMYVTGGLGSGETSEGFGADWSLGNNAYAESCAGCGQVYWQQSMQRTYRSGRYADLAEEALYNNVLGSIDLPGRNFTYTNALDADNARYDWHGCPCCVGNIPRTLLELPRWAYTVGDGGVYVNHYLGSRIDVGAVGGTPLTITQETDYPYGGKVGLTLAPRSAKRFALCLRLPDRQASDLYTPTPASSAAMSVSVNGKVVKAPQRDGYAVIDRIWQPGDKVTFELPLPIQRIHADARIKANVGRVALRRGPVIYNFESVDQKLDGVLAPGAKLTSEWRPDLLGGVVVIRGTWADGSPLLAVPNYARLNRGGRSVVWVREK